MIGKIFVIGCILLLVVIGGTIIDYSSQEKDKVKIDTGISPDQTWRIIHGEDVGEVLNLNGVNR